MKTNTLLLGQILRYCGVFGGALLLGSENMGLSLNSGSALAAPMFGYGGAGGSFGALNGCFGPGGYMGGGYAGGGGFGGAYASLPPPPRLIPPHLQGGGYFGGGMVGSPYLAQPGNCAMYCQPTHAYGQSQFMGPVQGGPSLMANAGMAGAASGSASGSNVYSISGSGTTVIDMRPRVEDNTGDIIWAAALGIGMQAPNVYPYAGERGAPTNFGPFLYNEGDRDWTLQPRPHAAP